MINKDENPWLKISAEDYEGHMSSPNVEQLHALSSIFANVLSKTNPKTIMFLGCTTGNGFEHLNPNVEILGLDINQHYLDLCRSRFSSIIPKLNLVCADLNTYENDKDKFDLVYAALIFEYVDVNGLLNKIYNWVNQEKYFVAVLQLESKSNPAISKTKFDSVNLLEPIHVLVKPEYFKKICMQIGFKEVSTEIINLPGEKDFLIIIFKK